MPRSQESSEQSEASQARHGGQDRPQTSRSRRRARRPGERPAQIQTLPARTRAELAREDRGDLQHPVLRLGLRTSLRLFRRSDPRPSLYRFACLALRDAARAYASCDDRDLQELRDQELGDAAILLVYEAIRASSSARLLGPDREEEALRLLSLLFNTGLPGQGPHTTLVNPGLSSGRRYRLGQVVQLTRRPRLQLAIVVTAPDDEDRLVVKPYVARSRQWRRAESTPRAGISEPDLARLTEAQQRTLVRAVEDGAGLGAFYLPPLVYVTKTRQDEP